MGSLDQSSSLACTSCTRRSAPGPASEMTGGIQVINRKQEAVSGTLQVLFAVAVDLVGYRSDRILMLLWFLCSTTGHLPRPKGSVVSVEAPNTRFRY